MKRLVVLAAIPFAYWAWQTDLRGREHRLLEQVSTIEAQNAQLRLELDRAAENRLTGRPLVQKLCEQAVKIEGLDWDEEQVEAMVRICWRESRYDPIDQNRESTAYGMYQFLDSTWLYTGLDKTSDPLLQTVAAVRYVKARYGNPTEALAFHRELHTVNGKQVYYY